MKQSFQNMKLKGEYSQFIGSYSNIYDDEFCDNIIKTFDYYQSLDTTSPVYCEDEQFENRNAGRFDWALDLRDLAASFEFDAMKILYENLSNCLKEYCQVFGTLSTAPLYSVNQKVQKTPAGGGYHVWHDENTNFEYSSRILTWMIYLNDDFEGGETEYLYYKRREQPEKGKLLIWPAGYTHVHRGGMVLSGNKYVITGWYYIGN